MRSSNITTAAAVIALSMATAAQAEHTGTRAVDDIARRQREAEQHKARLQRSKRKAVAALVKLGQDQIVLAHIQPRWLRSLATRILDAGEEVSFELLAQLRAEGLDRAADAVDQRLGFQA